MGAGKGHYRLNMLALRVAMLRVCLTVVRVPHLSPHGGRRGTRLNVSLCVRSLTRRRELDSRPCVGVRTYTSSVVTRRPLRMCAVFVYCHLCGYFLANRELNLVLRQLN